jgi:hypothetical protein
MSKRKRGGGEGVIKFENVGGFCLLACLLASCVSSKGIHSRIECLAIKLSNMIKAKRAI